jgi:hypothetical protein
MKVIARTRGTGKTRELLTIADENNGQVLTSNKRALQAKADAYGLHDLFIIDWNDMMYGGYDAHKPLYIHKADEVFAELFDNDFKLKLAGLSVTMED